LNSIKNNYFFLLKEFTAKYYKKMSESEDNNDSESNNELISRSETNLINIRYELARYFQRHIEECEDLIVPETNNNPNFMHEKDMKYNLYPFYINWKKLEANENNYYDMFVHYGYFGVSVYSSFRDIYPNITKTNIIYLFSSFCYDFLVNENQEQEKNEKELTSFLTQLPENKIIYKLIKKKIIMFKEIPIYLLILKIYEIYFLYKVQESKLLELLKYQYLLISYMTDEEYKEIYQNHFKGRVSSLFRKLVGVFGKQLELPITKNKFINHIKYIYQSINKNIKEEIKEEDNDDEEEKEEE
jgi:hypothetical protein